MPIQEAGYNVPKYNTIIGFDNRYICVNTKPKITTISVPKDIFVTAAVDLIINKIENGNECEYRLNGFLIIRESTANIK